MEGKAGLEGGKRHAQGRRRAAALVAQERGAGVQKIWGQKGRRRFRERPERRKREAFSVSPALVFGAAAGLTGKEKGNRRGGKKGGN